MARVLAASPTSVGFDRRRVTSGVSSAQLVTSAEIQKRGAIALGPPSPGTPPGAFARMPLPSPIDQIPARFVAGMEVYAGPAQMPVEFKTRAKDISAPCVVLIWTR